MIVKYLGGGAIIALVMLPSAKRVTLPNFGVGQEYRDKTVILTGATGNLGKAMVYRMAAKKTRVIMACRDMEKCKQIRREIVALTKHKGIACRHLDLEDIDSINRFADEMIKTEPHIDVLINNAAVKDVETKELTKYGVEKNYFVNFLGPYLLTMRLLDKLKESAQITRDSRIVNVIGSKPNKNWFVDLNDLNFEKRKYNSKEAYRQSKLALAYFTILLDEFCRKEKNLVHVFGSSPVYKTIAPSLHWPVTIMDEVYSGLKVFTHAKAESVVSITLRCALDQRYTHESSGKLFSWFGNHWGWGEAKEKIVKAKVVWNLAAQKLLDLSEPKPPKAQTDDEKSPSLEQDSGVVQREKDSVGGDNSSSEQVLKVDSI